MLNSSKIMAFDHLTYNELLDDYIQEYLNEFGRRQFSKVHKKIQISKKISNLIYTSRIKLLVPSEKDLFYILHEIPFFLVARAETVALGGLLGLERWNQECNQQLFLAYEDKLKEISVKILNESRKIKTRN